jgi:hypothetical protein
MKTKVFLTAALCLPLSVLLSCSGDSDSLYEIPKYDDYEYLTSDVLYSKGSRIKTEYQVFNENIKQVFTEYEYDDKGRISKVNHPTAYVYDIYEYNEKDLLECIISYKVYNSLPTLYRTVSYLYDTSGNKIKTITDGEDNGYEDVVIYTYENQKLIKEDSFYKGNLNHHKIYYYNDSGEVSTERLYAPKGDSFSETTHTYENGLLVYSITKSDGVFIYDSKKIYDNNDNLILRIDNCPGLSSAISYEPFLITRLYEYE